MLRALANGGVGRRIRGAEAAIQLTSRTICKAPPNVVENVRESTPSRVRACSHQHPHARNGAHSVQGATLSSTIERTVAALRHHPRVTDRALDCEPDHPRRTR